MTHKDIIDIIVNHKPYKRYCDKLCNYQDIANDLYQEFFLIMWNKSEEDLISIYNSGGLEKYCLFVLWNYSKKTRNFVQSSDNPLINICNYSEGLSDFVNNEDKYNHQIDIDFEKIMDFVSSDLSIKQEDWLIFTESIDTKLKDISKETGIPYITLKVKRKRIKDKIKENVSI